MTVWMNGTLLADSDARVSVFDHGLTVGDGVFETVKVAAGVPFALTRHLARLRRSAAGLGLPEPAAGARGEQDPGDARLHASQISGSAPG